MEQGTISMGNDEFILFIRKNYPENATPNDQLGKRAWLWLKEKDAGAEQLNGGESVPCRWGDGADVGETDYPWCPPFSDLSSSRRHPDSAPGRSLSATLAQCLGVDLERLRKHRLVGPWAGS